MQQIKIIAQWIISILTVFYFGSMVIEGVTAQLAQVPPDKEFIRFCIEMVVTGTFLMFVLSSRMRQIVMNW